MEPWLQEELRQIHMAARRARLPRCACCGEPVGTERFLDLRGFGLQALACETCVEENFRYTEELIVNSLEPDRRRGRGKGRRRVCRGR